MSMQIRTELTSTPKPKPDQSKLGFGKYFTDHMFIMDYEQSKGWYDPRIVPYGPLSMDPATTVLHYGQAIFEGMKAYKAVDGRIVLFRPKKNMERMNISNDRIAMPAIDENFCVEAIKALVKTESSWIPSAPGTSLYIRPFIIGTDAVLGVHPSHTYMFIVILSPVGAYYPTGLDPIKILIEDKFARSVRGGTGFAKVAGNYAASLKAQEVAESKGYVQVLWLDGVEKKYIDEVGAMNVFFKIDGEVVTPPLEGTILPGITRDSVLQLLKHWGIKVSERKISVQELFDAHAAGKLEEAFGTGTAAVISPIGELCWEDHVIKLTGGKIGEVSQKLYDTLTGIQYGAIKDEFGWVVEV